MSQVAQGQTAATALSWFAHRRMLRTTDREAPVAWGQFNSVPTGFTDEGAYGPDAQGRMWKWYEFADPGDFTIDLTGGQYWVLCVGGGDAG